MRPVALLLFLSLLPGIGVGKVSAQKGSSKKSRGITCEDVCASLAASVQNDPSSLKVRLEDALVIREECAREIVATAIAVVNAEPYRVREIIATAQNVLPWRQAEIASAANLASIPAAVALVEPQVAMPEFEVRRALVAAAPEETPVEEVRRAEVPEVEVRRAIVEMPKSTKKRRK
ncbi:MAG: hypothetical protein JNN17_06450 [Verrucomicrobiaceae bacterium]|nr:hypothetical protein [Verrucomicrobiaceae bacterium]